VIVFFYRLFKGNMLRLLFLLFCLLFKISAASSATSYIEKDFDESMCKNDSVTYNLMRRGKYSEEYLNFYRDLYNKNIPSKMDYSEKPRIPKIMHKLWIGPRKLPNLYKKYIENCKKLHPNWQHILWTDKEVLELGLDSDLYAQYKKRRSFEAQKDIVLHEVLHKYGGVFMDTDFDCVQKLDELHHKYDFYASLEPGVGWSKVPVQTIAIVGSKPGNKIFKDSLAKAQMLYFGLERESEPGLLDKLRIFFKSLNPLDNKDIIDKILFGINGFKVKDKELYDYCAEIVNSPLCKDRAARFIMMHSLASAFKDEYKDGDKSIVFPASYFNSVFPRSIKKYSLLDRVFMIKLKLKDDPYCFDSIKPETIAIQDFND
jgi:hypothetical protein